MLSPQLILLPLYIQHHTRSPPSAPPDCPRHWRLLSYPPQSTSILSLAPGNSSSLVIPGISSHNVLPFTESTGLSSCILFEFHFMLSLSLQPFAFPGKSQSSCLHHPCSKHSIGNAIPILASWLSSIPCQRYSTLQEAPNHGACHSHRICPFSAALRKHYAQDDVWKKDFIWVYGSVG